VFERHINAQIRKMTIRYFADDPDGDPDRFGDGYYYRVRGVDGWSGPWRDKEECISVHREILEDTFDHLLRMVELYEDSPVPGKQRYLLRFEGVRVNGCEPRFLMWPTKAPQQSVALVDVDIGNRPDFERLLAPYVQLNGPLFTAEVVGTLDALCRSEALDHPLSRYRVQLELF
jgi:hypothetical protein